MWKSLKKWWRREGDLTVLRGQSDRLLADIGLERKDLRARVHGQSLDRDKGRPIPLNRAPSRPGCAQQNVRVSCQ